MSIGMKRDKAPFGLTETISHYYEATPKQQAVSQFVRSVGSWLAPGRGVTRPEIHHVTVQALRRCSSGHTSDSVGGKT